MQQNKFKFGDVVISNRNKKGVVKTISLADGVYYYDIDDSIMAAKEDDLALYVSPPEPRTVTFYEYVKINVNGQHELKWLEEFSADNRFIPVYKRTTTPPRTVTLMEGE